MESFGVRICAFCEDAVNFLEISGRSRNRWTRFIILWLNANNTENIRRFHFFGDDLNKTEFKNGFITLFGRFEFDDSYRQQLSELVQTCSESVTLYAAQTTDLTTRAYPKFSTEN